MAKAFAGKARMAMNFAHNTEECKLHEGMLWRSRLV